MWGLAGLAFLGLVFGFHIPESGRETPAFPSPVCSGNARPCRRFGAACSSSSTSAASGPTWNASVLPLISAYRHWEMPSHSAYQSVWQARWQLPAGRQDGSCHTPGRRHGRHRGCGRCPGPGSEPGRFRSGSRTLHFVWNYSLAYQYAVVAAADDSGRCIARGARRSTRPAPLSVLLSRPCWSFQAAPGSQCACSSKCIAQPRFTVAGCAPGGRCQISCGYDGVVVTYCAGTARRWQKRRRSVGPGSNSALRP